MRLAKARHGDIIECMFGVLNIHKPAGITSHDAVATVRKRLAGETARRRKRRRRSGHSIKVGHAGTLDPFANGVLVMCVGPATRLIDYIRKRPKRYVAGITLGATSTTDDPEGEITPIAGAAAPAEDRIRACLDEFLGPIDQVPPAYSAIHVDGQRAYKLARSGKEPHLSPRKVHVHRISLLRYEYPLLEIEVACGGGTYIRALARDIGERLATGGYCSALTRTTVGQFTIEDAVAPDDLDPDRHLLPATTAVDAMPKVTVEGPSADMLANGRAVRLDTPLESKAPEVAVLDPDGQLLAIAAVTGNGRNLRPLKVLKTR